MQTSTPNKKNLKRLYYQKMVSKSQQRSRSQESRINRKIKHRTEDYKHTFSNYSYRANQREKLLSTLKAFTSQPVANQYVGSATAEQMDLSKLSNWLGYIAGENLSTQWK